MTLYWQQLELVGETAIYCLGDGFIGYSPNVVPNASIPTSFHPYSDHTYTLPNIAHHHHNWVYDTPSEPNDLGTLVKDIVTYQMRFEMNRIKGMLSHLHFTQTQTFNSPPQFRLQEV